MKLAIDAMYQALVAYIWYYYTCQVAVIVEMLPRSEITTPQSVNLRFPNRSNGKYSCISNVRWVNWNRFLNPSYMHLAKLQKLAQPAYVRYTKWFYLVDYTDDQMVCNCRCWS